jgi:acid phosphatase
VRGQLQVILFTLLLVSCRSLPGAPPLVEVHEGLDAVLWVQTSAEYLAASEQAYGVAAERLDEALRPENPGWTAIVDQTSSAAGLPPAVILDVDDTVLATGPFQARIVGGAGRFRLAAWNAWVREEGALPVPGALAFARHARHAGVRIFYVTNREPEVEGATRRNLQRLGFPVDEDGANILSRGERDGWESKERRRAFVAAKHRVLLIVGDGLADFVSGSRVRATERIALTQRYAAYWGRRWILIPNPMYGDWERALYGFDGALPRDETLRRKYRELRALEPDRPHEAPSGPAPAE